MEAAAAVCTSVEAVAQLPEINMRTSEYCRNYVLTGKVYDSSGKENLQVGSILCCFVLCFLLEAGLQTVKIYGKLTYNTIGI